MKLDALEIFCAVARAGSFVGAASHLGRPTSSVSRTIAELEGAIGLPLFYRTTRVVTLTTAGQRLMDAADQHIRALRADLHIFSEDEDDMRGELSITVPSLMGRGRVGRALLDFATRHPNLRLRILPSNQNRDLISERIDLALRFGPLPDSTFVATKLARFDYIFCAKTQDASEYAARIAEEGLGTTLAAAPCVVCRPLLRWHFQDRRGQTHGLAPSAVIEVGDMELAAEAVAMGMGVGYLSARFATEFDGRISSITLAELAPRSRDLFALCPTSRIRSRTTQALIQHLKASLARPLAEQG